MSIRLPKIFLDSGDPAETRKARGILGFLDGQTTNPSLVVKNPEAAKYLAKGKKLTEGELLNLYRQIIKELDRELAGPISVEVYADWKTKAANMLKQAEVMYTWGKNIYIKLPTIPEGLKAAREFTKKGGRVNMTLVFDQNQAAAAYASTAQSTHVNFVSPFVGRWDDRGYLGLDLLKNIVKMYKKLNKINNIKKPHILTLAASIRSLGHFYGAIFMGADIITIPLKVIYQWIEEEKWLPDKNYRLPTHGLKSIRYEEVPYKRDYEEYKINKTKGCLLDEGLNKFIKDWKKLLL
jgi:transaldolase